MLRRPPDCLLADVDVWLMFARAAVGTVQRIIDGDTAPVESVPAGWDNDALLRESMHALADL